MATETTPTSGAEETSPATVAAPATQPSDGTQTTEPKAEKTLSQADIDNAVRARLEREQRKHEEELATFKKTLADYDASLKSYREKEDAEHKAQEEKELKRLQEKGEWEQISLKERARYEEQLKKEQEERAKIAADRDALREKTQNLVIEKQLLSEFAKQSHSPDDAIALFLKSNQVSVSDAGVLTINGDTAADIPATIAAFLEKRDYLARGRYTDTKGSGTPTGHQAAPANGQPTFKHSDLKNFALYSKNKDAMDLAVKENRILPG